MMNLENTLAVKLPVSDIPARACIVLKRLTGLSLSEIKSRAINDEFLFICDYVDDDGLKLVNKIRREMEKFDISVRQYEDGIEKPSGLFDSIERLHRQIDEQYGAYDDEF